MTNQPPSTFAFAGDLRNYVVRLAPGVSCPYCRRQAQAYDFEVRTDGAFWICQGDNCHRDILTVTLS